MHHILRRLFQPVILADEISCMANLEEVMAQKLHELPYFLMVWPWPLSLKFFPKIFLSDKMSHLAQFNEVMVPKLHFYHMWSHFDFNLWPLDPKICSVHHYVIPLHPWKFAANVMFSSKVWMLTNLIGCTDRQKHWQTTEKDNASNPEVGKDIDIAQNVRHL